MQTAEIKQTSQINDQMKRLRKRQREYVKVSEEAQHSCFSIGAICWFLRLNIHAEFNN